MPAKLRMIITDPQGKVADREVTISNKEWETLVKGHEGWERRGVTPNPNFDPQAGESPQNPKFLDYVDDRWQIADQAQKHFERLFRSAATKEAKRQARQNIEAETNAALQSIIVKDEGDVQ